MLRVEKVGYTPELYACVFVNDQSQLLDGLRGHGKVM